MVKKKGRKPAADKAPKTSFLNMLFVLFKKRPYLAIGGAFLLLVMINLF